MINKVLEHLRWMINKVLEHLRGMINKVLELFLRDDQLSLWNNFFLIVAPIVQKIWKYIDLNGNITDFEGAQW